MKPIDQLKSVLAESGYDVINEDGYKMLENAKVITTVEQAKVIAQLVKDIAEATMPVIIKVVLIKRLKMGRN